MLFDLGSTYSYVYAYFATCLGLSCEPLMHITTPIGDSILLYHVYKYFVRTIWEYKTLVGPVILDMVNFNAILGMY